jgi:hypothetical protein
VQHDPGNRGVEALGGYRVITPSGKLIGEVVRASETEMLVRMRRLGRSIYRPLAQELAIVSHRHRTVVLQISQRELRGAPTDHI